MSPGFTPRPSLSDGGELRLQHLPRVSPGFTPRPSLSAGEHRPADAADSAAGVAGVHAPAFVERAPFQRPATGRSPEVSPGFTPRPSLSGGDRGSDSAGVGVSPGFTPRPSLSAGDDAVRFRRGPGVAGVHAPAFVERRCASTPTRALVVVSPGFTPRPSLSAADHRRVPDRIRRVSPGFTPRPSLSVRGGCRGHRALHRVAGVHAPAFVERCCRSSHKSIR